VATPGGLVVVHEGRIALLGPAARGWKISPGKALNPCGVQILNQGCDLGSVRRPPPDAVIKMNAFKSMTQIDQNGR